MIKNRWINPNKEVTQSYEGRNIIVTGATSGIGLEAVVKFAKLGAAKIIITARDMEKGKKTKADIEARVGRTDQLEVWELHMESYDSVVAFAKRAEQLDHIDIAVLNAGVRRSKYVATKHGWEEALQVNVLSTTLLGILLLPKLKTSKATTGRIPILQFVNSGLHQNAIVSPKTREEPRILDWYNRSENFGESNQYSFSKVFLMYATNKLAAEVSSGEIIITSVCPGLVKTDMGRDHYFPGVSIAFFILGLLVLNPPDVGANIILSGTTQGEKIHGRFWKQDSVFPIAPSLAGEENKKLGQRVWNEILDELEKDAPAFKEAFQQSGLSR